MQFSGCCDSINQVITLLWPYYMTLWSNFSLYCHISNWGKMSNRKTFCLRPQQIDYLVYGFFYKKCHTEGGFSFIHVYIFLVCSINKNIRMAIIYLYRKFHIIMILFGVLVFTLCCWILNWCRHFIAQKT